MSAELKATDLQSAPFAPFEATQFQHLDPATAAAGKTSQITNFGVNAMRFKKSLSLLLALILACSLVFPAAAAAEGRTIHVDPIDVMVGGKVFLPADVTGKDVPVFVYNGTTYAPLRALAEAYGLTVGYNAEKKLATVDGVPNGKFTDTKGTEKALTAAADLWVTPINIEVNGKVFEPKDVNGNAVSIFVYEGTTYAPLRALAEEKRLATVDFVGPSLSLEDVLDDINAEKKALIEKRGAFSGFSNWLKADRNLLTQAEVDALTTHSGNRTVSYAEAVADIELYFKTLKYAYGAYYYFGGDAAFNAAKAEAIAALGGQSGVTPSAIAQAIFNSVDFVMDGHFSVGGPSIVEYEEYKKIYFYSDLEFSKEGSRFYTIIDGENWYFSKFSNPEISIEYTLTKNGRLVYSPALICPKPEVGSDTVTLVNGSETRTLALNWTESRSMLGSYSPAFDFKTLEENGVGYISLRSFDSSDPITLDRFAASGADFRDCEVIIFDIRGNGGGSDIYADMWVQNFSGESIALPTAHCNRITALSRGSVGNERIEEFYINGKMIPNDIPILVLVDNYCASAGESMLLFLKTLENAAIIGSSSAGYQLAGNRVDLTLPNCGVPFSFGTSFSFKFDTTNVDGVGYAPDIYCDPVYALDAALALVGSDMKIEHNLESSGPPAAFDPGSSRITLEIFDSTVFAGQTFGADSGTYYLPISLDGNVITDFTFTNSDDSVASFQKVAGQPNMKITGTGYSVLSITAGGVTTSFGVYVGNFVDMPDGISIGFQGRLIPAGEGFGYHTGMEAIDVFVDGRRVTDFTYKLDNPSVVEVIEMYGQTFLYFKGNGSSKLTITADGQTAEFRVGVIGYEDAGSPRITIDYGDATVYAGHGFGWWEEGPYALGIRLDGELISDYTFDYENNGVLSCKRDGNLTVVTVTGEGNCFITVTAGGVSTTFRWAAIKPNY